MGFASRILSLKKTTFCRNFIFSILVPARLAQAVGMSLYSAIKGVERDWEAALWPERDERLVTEATPPRMQEDGSEHLSAPVSETI